MRGLNLWLMAAVVLLAVGTCSLRAGSVSPEVAMAAADAAAPVVDKGVDVLAGLLGELGKVPGALIRALITGTEKNPSLLSSLISLPFKLVGAAIALPFRLLGSVESPGPAVEGIAFGVPPRVHTSGAT